MNPGHPHVDITGVLSGQQETDINSKHFHKFTTVNQFGTSQTPSTNLFLTMEVSLGIIKFKLANFLLHPSSTSGDQSPGAGASWRPADEFTY